MESTAFYWVFWSFWAYLTFILKKQNSFRLRLSAAILITIILANIHLKFAAFDINLGGLFLLLFSYASLSKQKTSMILYMFICSLIETIAYVTFHLFEMFDPVWLIFDKEWMMGICIGYLAILLQKKLTGRMFIILSGMMQGEILYAYILSQYDFPYPIGSYTFFDAFALTSLFLVGWSIIEHAGPIFENHFNPGQKDKQKSS